MKKINSGKIVLLMILCVVFAVYLCTPVFSADPPVILLQPQSPNFPEYSVASYTVKASGKNLSCTWYMEFQGKTYNISTYGGAIQPWENFAGEAYGAYQEDDNTFGFFFSGIEYDLDGAYIWCVIEDGHFDVTSQKARISVGNPSFPPTILDIPSEMTVFYGDTAEIRCIALAPGDTQLTWLWYETPTGRLEDICALSREPEYSDSWTLDTSLIGTRYYVCMVESSDGGMTYSSIVPVTVLDYDPMPPEPSIITEYLPDAQVGEEYSFMLECSEPSAEFFVYYNPGHPNEFDKTGLTLNAQGLISGQPKQAGSFTFTVCASHWSGEDYRSYTLTVEPQQTNPVTTKPVETQPQETEPAETLPVVTQPHTAADPTQPQTDPTNNHSKEPQETKPPVSQDSGNFEPSDRDEEGGLSVLNAVLIAAVAALSGLCIGLIFALKKR